LTVDPLAPAVVAGLLQSAVTTLRAELTALPESVLTYHPAPGEWCAKEIVGHLTEAERRGFAGRIRIILAEETPKLQAWDQATVARERHDCAQDVKALLDELEELREDSVALVTGLRRDDLARAGEHPKVGRLSVGELLQEWVHHDRNHLRQILANVQAWAWANMGNAQRFSAD
jgi:hypothetical protein